MKIVKYYYSKPRFIGKFVGNLDNINIKSIKPLRRYTVAIIYDDEHCEIRMGIAICQPVDNFSKKIGRELAYKNALIKPFYTISNFSGHRNEYINEIYNIIQDKEHRLNNSIH